MGCGESLPTVQLRVIEVKNVPNNENGTCSPYVQAGIIGLDNPKKTKTIKNSNTPTWNTVLTLQYRDQTNDRIKIALYDQDRAAPEPVAVLEIPLQSIDNEKGVDQFYKMVNETENKDQKGIQIHLSIHF